MQVILEVIKKKSNINRVILKERTLIGRSSKCNLKIASSQVSRKHCEIEISELGVSVRDLGSANGTQVNGKTIPVKEPFFLSPGSQLQIGNVTFIVQFKPEQESEESGSTVEIAAYRDIENLNELEKASSSTAPADQNKEFLKETVDLSETAAEQIEAEDVFEAVPVTEKSDQMIEAHVEAEPASVILEAEPDDETAAIETAAIEAEVADALPASEIDAVALEAEAVIEALPEVDVEEDVEEDVVLEVEDAEQEENVQDDDIMDFLSGIEEADDEGSNSGTDLHNFLGQFGD